MVVVVQRVKELTDAQARKRDITLEVAAADSPQRVLGEPEQLVQVTLSIVLNGIDALQESTSRRELRVEIRGEHRGSRDYGVIEVSNTGPAIPDDQLERIFDPFVTTKDDGTGLGLSIAARIVDAHDGHIEASNIADGVRFRILIPAA